MINSHQDFSAESLELKPCPFCGSAIGLPFPNLRDGDEDDGCPVSCWTIQHTCTVTKGTIWAEGDERSDCVSAWNARAVMPTVAQPTRPTDRELHGIIASSLQREGLTHSGIQRAVDQILALYAAQPPAAPAAQGAHRRQQIQFDVEAYVQGYEFRDQGLSHVPTEPERVLIADAIHGALYEINTAQPPAAPVTDGSIQEGDVLSYTMKDGVGKVTAHVRPHSGCSAGNARATVLEALRQADAQFSPNPSTSAFLEFLADAVVRALTATEPQGTPVMASPADVEEVLANLEARK